MIPKFIAKAPAGEPPVIYGNGLQTRDFVFVKDVVRANIMAAKSNETGVFNIGSGEGITINELAGKIISLTGRNMEPVHSEERKGDIKHSRSSIDKAKSIHYRPEYSLKEGLMETITWFGKY